MVTVRVSETYDLSTKVNKMGFVGIHTPTGNLIPKLWPGLCLQYEKFRFVKCDVAMACASMLPADPLQVGVEAGAIAPQDMFNPILYRAVSNDSMNNILRFVQAAAMATPALDVGLEEGSVVSFNNADFKSDDTGNPSIDQFNIYYALLADSDGWRKAMPQAGLTMTGLYPLVYQMISSYGPSGISKGSPANTVTFPGVADADGQIASTDGTISSDATNYMIRGPSMRMPSLPTMFYSEVFDGDVIPSFGFLPNAYMNSNLGSLDPAYVGLIVLPPAKLNQLYYRLKITWTIEFTGLRSMADISAWNRLGVIGSSSYGTDYDEQSTSMASKLSMADTAGADIQKVMEGS